MKNLKYFTLLFCLISMVTFAKNDDNKVSFFESKANEAKATTAESPTDPEGGSGGDDASPIDDYLPLLVIGAGLIALRFRKQIVK